jgi:hypothetical protein
MLLKDTPVGDIEVQAEDEADARAFVQGLVARNQIAVEGEQETRLTTHKVVIHDGKRVLERVRF